MRGGDRDSYGAGCIAGPSPALGTAERPGDGRIRHRLGHWGRDIGGSAVAVVSGRSQHDRSDDGQRSSGATDTGESRSKLVPGAESDPRGPDGSVAVRVSHGPSAIRKDENV